MTASKGWQIKGVKGKLGTLAIKRCACWHVKERH